MNMRSAVPFLAPLGLLAAPLPAFADGAPVKSTSDSVGRGKQGLIDGAREIRRLAGCSYKRVPGYFDALLATGPGSQEERNILDRASNVVSNCMNSLAPMIYMSWREMRGSFAEARYLAQNPVAPNFGSGERPMFRIPAEWTERNLDEAEKLAILKYDFADCVVAADPSSSDALLRTEPYTAEEGAAVSRLVPQLGPCLQDGKTYQLDAPILRGLIAQALDSSTRRWLQSPTPEKAAN
jgi:hypothetical protein